MREPQVRRLGAGARQGCWGAQEGVPGLELSVQGRGTRAPTALVPTREVRSPGAALSRAVTRSDTGFPGTALAAVLRIARQESRR